MNFEPTEDQRMLASSLDRVLGERSHASGGFDRWQEFAELGLLGLLVPEDRGGVGGGPFETMTVMESLGRHLAEEPFQSSGVVCAFLLSHATGPAVQQVTERMIGGKARLALVHGDRDGAPIVAYQAASGRRIGGSAIRIAGGDTADYLLVAVDQGEECAHGVDLILLPANAVGITRNGYRAHDGKGGADIRFDDVAIDANTEIGLGAPLIHELLRASSDMATAACCAEASGAMSALFDLTTVQLKTRRQFGVAIGTFQALQHRLADMFIALEQARSAAILAAHACTLSPPERARRISAAKIQINSSARLIGQEAVQMHGGMGMAAEGNVARYFKRLTLLRLAHGDSQYHAERLYQSGGLELAVEESLDAKLFDWAEK